MTHLQEDRGFLSAEKKSTPLMQLQNQNFPDRTTTEHQTTPTISLIIKEQINDSFFFTAHQNQSS